MLAPDATKGSRMGTAHAEVDAGRATAVTLLTQRPGRPATVALIRPPVDILVKSMSMLGPMPPIGIAHVAAALRSVGHDVQVIDAAGEALDQLEEYENAVAECQSLERQLRDRKQQATDAKQFFYGIAMDARTHGSDPLGQITAPPSGFVDHNAPSCTSHTGSKLSFTEMVSATAETPGLPLLGLTSQRDVAHFFAAVLSKKVGP